ncbi:MAG: hypothetical protein HUK18_05005 [Bacteroidales bacterium]|nr:hypothetical protein [Bacteroidales bacterium]
MKNTKIFLLIAVCGLFAACSKTVDCDCYVVRTDASTGATYEKEYDIDDYEGSCNEITEADLPVVWDSTMTSRIFCEEDD